MTEPGTGSDAVLDSTDGVGTGGEIRFQSGLNIYIFLAKVISF